jgi:hypothetical protein
MFRKVKSLELSSHKRRFGIDRRRTCDGRRRATALGRASSSCSATATIRHRNFGSSLADPILIFDHVSRALIAAIFLEPIYPLPQ